MSAEHVTQIYVMRHEHGFLKIGKSDNPRQRLKALQNACPYELELFTTIQVNGDWHIVEDRLHNIFDENNVKGEWFELPAKDLVSLSYLNSINSAAVKSNPNWTPANYLREKQGQHADWILKGEYEVAR